MHDQATRMRTIARAYGAAARPPRPYLLTITSGKGGVGKSTLALNVGIALANHGKRVLLVDADANLAGLDVLCGISPRFRLGDVLRGERDLEEILVSPHPGVKLLPGSSGDPGYPRMDRARQGALLEEILDRDEKTDVVVIDTAAGMTPEIVQFAEEADSVLVVTTAEPTSVMDAYAMIKVMGMSAPSQSVNLVMNSVRSAREGEETFTKLLAAVRHFLRREVGCAGIIPRDDHVAEAIRKQQPLVTAFPRSAAALSVLALSHTLVHAHLHASLQRRVAL